MEEERSQDQMLYRPGQFRKGQSGNPGGRPKGSISLKTYAKKYLAEMTDEEKMEFMDGLPKEIIWKMAEGNPAQDTKLSGEVTLVQPIMDVTKKPNEQTTSEQGQDTME